MITTKIVASSFIKRASDGKYLLLRRSDTDVSRKGEWDLAGGVVDEGETISQGALREVKEEAGLTQVESCRLVFSASGISYSATDNEEKNYVFLYYYLTVSGDEDITLSFEHDRYLWVTRDDLEGYLTHRAQVAAYHHIFDNSLDKS